MRRRRECSCPRGNTKETRKSPGGPTAGDIYNGDPGRRGMERPTARAEVGEFGIRQRVTDRLGTVDLKLRRRRLQPGFWPTLGTGKV